MLQKSFKDKKLLEILTATWEFVDREVERIQKMPEQPLCLKNIWKEISLNLAPYSQRRKMEYLSDINLPWESMQPLQALHPKYTRATRRGFAAMDKTHHKELASLGGRVSHAKGRAHEFSSEEARQAGRKGGLAVSQNRQHMSTIGRKGGLSCALKRKTL